jgi:sulfoxide reductase heme-binding subunit YedZ
VARDAPKPLVFSSGPLPWLWPAVVTGASVPLVAIPAGLFRGTLGANPVAEALNELGLLALVFLVASLACSPIKTLTGQAWPIRLRKTLGLFSFLYASLHLLTYVGVDQLMNLSAVLDDIAKRPFISVGLAAWVVLVPLAITSTARMLKRLGFARWKLLHRFAYVAASLAVIHFFLRVKKDVTEPLVYAALLGALFLVRLLAFVRDGRRRAVSAASSPRARRAGA